MSGMFLLNILQNICIKPTTRDVHVSIIKAFVTYNLFHFSAKHIVTFCDLYVLLELGVAFWWLLIWLCIIYNYVYKSVCSTCHINKKTTYLLTYVFSFTSWDVNLIVSYSIILKFGHYITKMIYMGTCTSRNGMEWWNSGMEWKD